MSDKSRGYAALLQVYDDIGLSWVTIGGMVLSTVVIDNDIIDVSTKDGSNWRELLPSVIGMAGFAGSGIFVTPSENWANGQMASKVLQGAILPMRFISGHGDTVSGDFIVVTLQRDAENGNGERFSAEFASAGVVDWAGYTPPVIPPVITSALSGSFSWFTAFSYQITADNDPTSFGASPIPLSLSVDGVSGLIDGEPYPPSITVDFGSTHHASSYPGSPVWDPGIQSLPYFGYGIDPNGGSVPGYHVWGFRQDSGSFSLYAALRYNPDTGDLYLVSATYLTGNLGSTYNAVGNTKTGRPLGIWNFSIFNGAYQGGTTWPSSISASAPSDVLTLSIGLSATNSAGTDNKTLLLSSSLIVPVITSPLSVPFEFGVDFSYQITADNAPTSFGASGLPIGLSVDVDGLISGKPLPASVRVNYGTTNLISSYSGAPTWIPGIQDIPYQGYGTRYAGYHTWLLAIPSGGFTKEVIYNYNPGTGHCLAVAQVYDTSNPAFSSCWISWNSCVTPPFGICASPSTTSAVIGSSTWPSTVTSSASPSEVVDISVGISATNDAGSDNETLTLVAFYVDPALWIGAWETTGVDVPNIVTGAPGGDFQYRTGTAMVTGDGSTSVGRGTTGAGAHGASVNAAITDFTIAAFMRGNDNGNLDSSSPYLILSDPSVTVNYLLFHTYNEALQVSGTLGTPAPLSVPGFWLRDLAFHHYAFSYKASTKRLRCYRDGVELFSFDTTHDLFGGITPAAFYLSLPSTHKGWIKNPVMTREVLSQAAISALAVGNMPDSSGVLSNNPPPPPASGFKYYRLRFGSYGTRLYISEIKLSLESPYNESNRVIPASAAVPTEGGNLASPTILYDESFPNPTWSGPSAGELGSSECYIYIALPAQAAINTIRVYTGGGGTWPGLIQIAKSNDETAPGTHPFNGKTWTAEAEVTPSWTAVDAFNARSDIPVSPT